MLKNFINIISKNLVVNILSIFFILTFLTKIFVSAPYLHDSLEDMITFGTGFLLVLLFGTMYLIHKGFNSRITEFIVSLILALIYFLLSISNVIAIKNVL